MANRNFITLVWVTICSLVAWGCHKNANSSAVTSPEVAPQAIETAFQNADSNIKAQAATVALATKNQDPAALPAITRMLQNSELTGQQRSALGRCLPVALSATRAAAERGDMQAAQSLKAYNASR